MQLLCGSRLEQEGTNREAVVEVCYGPPIRGEVVDVMNVMERSPAGRPFLFHGRFQPSRRFLE